MMTLDQWRIKLEIIDPMKPADPALKVAPTAPTITEPQEDDTKSDFSWLKYFFGKTKDTPKAGMATGLRPRVSRLRSELSSDYQQAVAGEVERAKDKFASLMNQDKSKANFKTDIPAATAMKFAVQIMGSILKQILPDADQTGGGEAVSTGTLGRYMGDEGDGDWSKLKKVVGQNRIPLPQDILNTLRSVVINMKNKYAQDYHIDNWREDTPEVKKFALDVLAAVLKTVFPAEEASGGGRAVNFNKMSSYLDKMRDQPRPPEQAMEPPQNLEV